ncbi:type II toxin-antitoxin system RelE/ParE family toxin [Enterobacteriaceae bacterium 89]|nr:type II toxin-antitoxin system RelE/ParE family toxin [Enterobacteriaceae bacterium 89]
MFKLEVHKAVQEEILALPLKAQARFFHQLEKLRTNPTALREPDSKPLGHGLFELRTVGLFHTRGLYVYRQERTLWLLRVFVKKTQKTPEAELRLAMNRLREMHDEQNNH